MLGPGQFQVSAKPTKRTYPFKIDVYELNVTKYTACALEFRRVSPKVHLLKACAQSSSINRYGFVRDHWTVGHVTWERGIWGH